MSQDKTQIPTSFRSLMAISRGTYGVPFKDASLTLIDVPLHGREVKKYLPFGLWPTDPAMATLFFASYPIFPYGEPYREAIMMVHVRTLLGRGLHCCWILLDNDAALIAGRDFLGYPKKLGEVTYEENEDGVSAAVTRRGVRVMAVEARRERPEDNPDPVFGYKTFNVGGPGQMLVFNPLVLFRPREVIHESYAAKAELELTYSVFDPIAEMVAGDPVRARIVRMDISGRAKYYLPLLGYTGGWRWYLNTFNMRFR